MPSARYVRPLVVVAATDLLLAIVCGSPWVAKWVFSGRHQGDSLAKDAAQMFLFSAWGAGGADWELAQGSEHWRAGILLRILVFAVLHVWVVRQFARRTGPGWKRERTAAWVFAPVAGALAGLAMVAPEAFDPSTTTEGRALIRLIAVESLGDGAYWGLFSGAVCWVVLTILSRFAHRRPKTVDDGDLPEPRLIGCLPVFLAPVLAVIAAIIVVAVAGGSAVFGRAGELSEDHYPTATGRLAAVLSHLRWQLPDGSNDEYAPYASLPLIALVIYLLTLFLLLMTSLGEHGDQRSPKQYPPSLPLTNPDVLATSPGLAAFAKGWNAAIWAAIVSAVAVAEVKALIGVLTLPGGQRGIVIMVREFLFELPHTAAYTAVLGWVPAVAVLVSARLLRGLLSLLDDGRDAEEATGDADSKTDLASEGEPSEEQAPDEEIAGKGKGEGDPLGGDGSA